MAGNAIMGQLNVQEARVRDFINVRPEISDGLLYVIVKLSKGMNINKFDTYELLVCHLGPNDQGLWTDFLHFNGVRQAARAGRNVSWFALRDVVGLVDEAVWDVHIGPAGDNFLRLSSNHVSKLPRQLNWMNLHENLDPAWISIPHFMEANLIKAYGKNGQRLLAETRIAMAKRAKVLTLTLDYAVKNRAEKLRMLLSLRADGCLEPLTSLGLRGGTVRRFNLGPGLWNLQLFSIYLTNRQPGFGLLKPLFYHLQLAGYPTCSICLATAGLGLYPVGGLGDGKRCRMCGQPYLKASDDRKNNSQYA